MEENIKREIDATTVRSLVNQIQDKLVEADAEIFYSEFDMQDYRTVQTHLRTITQHVVAINAALSTELNSIKDSDKYRKYFAIPLEASLNDISGSIQCVLLHSRDCLMGVGHTNHIQRRLSAGSTIRNHNASLKSTGSDASTKVKATESARMIDALDRGYAKFEEEQFQVMYDLFELSMDGLTNKTNRPSWESLLEVNFFLFGLQAIIEEIKALSKFIHRHRKKRLHFRFKHYLPNFVYSLFMPKSTPKDNHKVLQESAKSDEAQNVQEYPKELWVAYRKPKPLPKQTYRSRVVKILRFFQSPASMYGLKVIKFWQYLA